MNLTIEKAKKIVNSYDSHSTDLYSQSKGFIDGWNQAIEKCAGIVDRQLDIESETGGEEELTTARNLILSLKVTGGK